jgi:hypothetical protein
MLTYSDLIVNDALTYQASVEYCKALKMLRTVQDIMDAHDAHPDLQNAILVVLTRNANRLGRASGR